MSVSSSWEGQARPLSACLSLSYFSLAIVPSCGGRIGWGQTRVQGGVWHSPLPQPTKEMQNIEIQTKLCVVNNSHQCFHGLDIEICLPPLSMLLVLRLIFGQLWQINLPVGRKFSPLLNLTFRSIQQNYLGQALATCRERTINFRKMPYTHSPSTCNPSDVTAISIGFVAPFFLLFQPFIHQERLNRQYIFIGKKKGLAKDTHTEVNNHLWICQHN